MKQSIGDWAVERRNLCTLGYTYIHIFACTLVWYACIILNKYMHECLKEQTNIYFVGF